MTTTLRAEYGPVALKNQGLVVNHERVSRLMREGTHLDQERFLIRVYGWLMFEEDEQDQVGISRATLWGIHPIIQIQFREKPRLKNTLNCAAKPAWRVLSFVVDCEGRDYFSLNYGTIDIILPPDGQQSFSNSFG